MEYLLNEEYDYIMNKYHDQAKPFNPLRRFVRNDSIFDESTGLDAEHILNTIMVNDENYKHLPRLKKGSRNK